MPLLNILVIFAVLCKIKRKTIVTYKGFYWTDLFRFCMNSELVGFTLPEHEYLIIRLSEVDYL